MPPANSPKISVVVPIYNVDRYLDECLSSVAAQDVQDFEAILVDDGSTDGSAAIASQWCDRDSRFRLVQQENHGLGHARNTGVRHVTGSYLAFLDSDDIVPPDAYRSMIEALDESGSDFATGNVHRYDSSGESWQAPLYRGMAKARKLGTHVTRQPDLLRDHLAHNKVWRTSFWMESEAEFPVGVLYEDVPTTIPAHVRAHAVDIVPIVAILWRVRDQGDSSITQQRNSDASHIRDRVDGVLTASRFIGEHASQKLKDEYDFLVLRRDLRWYVDLYPEVDELYRDELFTSIRRFTDQVSPATLRRVPVNLRPAYALIEAGARDDFAEFVAMRLSDDVNQIPVTVDNGRAVIDLDLPGGTELPTYAIDVTDQLKVATNVSDLALSDTEIVINGWAYISQLPAGRLEPQEIKVWMESAGRKVPASLTYRSDARAVSDSNAAAESTGHIAFTARVPIKSLRRWPKQRGTTWRAMLSVNNSGIELTSQLQNPLPGKPERPIMRELRRGQWLRVSWSKTGLSCRIRIESAVLESVKAADDALELTVRTSKRVGRRARLRTRVSKSDEGTSFRAIRDTNDARRARVRVPIADLPGSVPTEISPAEPETPATTTPSAEPETPATTTPSAEPEIPATKSWDVLFKASDSTAWQWLLDPHNLRHDALVFGDSEITVRRNHAGGVELGRGNVAPELTKAEWTADGELVLSLTRPEATEFEAVVLRARLRKELVAFPITDDGSGYSATLPIFAIPRFDEIVPLRAGTWDLMARSGDTNVPVRIGRNVLDDFPSRFDTGRRQATLTDSKRQSICMTVEGDLQPTERGTTNQARLRNEVYPTLKTKIRDAVLYEVYYGKEFSDSPRQIFNELTSRNAELEHIVAVRDQQFNLPEGAVAVPYRSERYYEALAQSRFIVANTHLPACFTRADGQTVLQTWHGIGTKKLGLDMDTVHFANKSYLDNIRGGETDNWDYLVSPNPFTSPILERAFAYRGTLLETGAPRNDIFHRPDRDEIAARVKRRLGIPDGTNVVLYAPTWRDNAFDGPGRYRLDLRFDLPEAAKRLGDDYTLVFRKHSNVVDRLPLGDGTVIDASDYPEVQELLLITDVLISDYSTLMCDFANTGRPMLFYTYDLANYRDILRGFYFDFEAEVPGPLITDEADLVPAILDADKIRVDHDAKYQAFAARFCPWDDGLATKRIVDAVFGSSD